MGRGGIGVVQLEWSDDELIACWTLVADDWRLLANKSGATRLGFALMLKFFELEGRFPADVTELPERGVDYVAELVKVDVSELASYGWSGRTIKYHRTQIREALGFRVCTEGDQDKLAVWLAEEVCPGELNRDRLRDAVLARCRADRIEPPSPGQLGRVVGSAVTSFEDRFAPRSLGAYPLVAPICWRISQSAMSRRTPRGCWPS
jgi:hypothetical protein